MPDEVADQKQPKRRSGHGKVEMKCQVDKSGHQFVNEKMVKGMVVAMLMTTILMLSRAKTTVLMLSGAKMTIKMHLQMRILIVGAVAQAVS